MFNQRVAILPDLPGWEADRQTLMEVFFSLLIIAILIVAICIYVYNGTKGE
jgi:cytochrome b561